VENHVLRGVGSYGKQLGLILDVLSVLVSRLPQNDLTPQERLVLDRFQHLFRGVKAAVADYQGPQNDDITQGDIDRVADGLRSLARSDAETYRRLVGRLLGAINTEHAEQR
jgi:hypothetical protein